MAQFTVHHVTTRLAFTNQSFANPTFQVVHSLEWTPRFAADSTPLSWSTPNPQLLFSRSASAVENCTIESFQAPPMSSQATYILRAVANAPTIHEFQATSRADSSRVTIGQANGLATLAFNSVSAPFSSAGVASYTVRIPGDWTSFGAGSGQLEMVALDGAWSVDMDWTFDGSETAFRALRQTGTSGAGLRFVLHGAAVPGPGGATALIMAGLCVRRRRSPIASR